MPDFSGQNPNLQLQSPNISINEASREGLVNVIFQLDPKIVDWVFNIFYDSHVENTGTKDKPQFDGVANSTYYECPICHATKNKDTSISKQTYLTCSGTEKEPHVPSSTYPLDWKPILKKAGLRFVLGQLNSVLNTNIATGNTSGSTDDLKKKLTLEERMRYMAWFQSYSTIAVLVGFPSLYVADWVVEKKQLHSIFSMGFCTNFIVTMSNNIMANLTKGKNMAMVGKVLETKVSTEAQTHHEIDYQYPQGMAIAQKKSLGEKLGSVFDFAK